MLWRFSTDFKVVEFLIFLLLSNVIVFIISLLHLFDHTKLRGSTARVFSDFPVASHHGTAADHFGQNHAHVLCAVVVYSVWPTRPTAEEDFGDTVFQRVEAYRAEYALWFQLFKRSGQPPLNDAELVVDCDPDTLECLGSGMKL